MTSPNNTIDQLQESAILQAAVRHAELEIIHRAAIALKDADPDIDKKILIETNDENITVEADGN